MKNTPPRVLILDSDVDALPPLRRLLLDRGCRVETCSSPGAAIQHVVNVMPDAVLTSIGFQGYTGLEIVRRLRKGSPRSWIIVMAPLDDCPSLWEAADAGADAIVSKPPQDEEVLRRLHDILEGQNVMAVP